MDDKFVAVHDYILCVIHDLIFDGFGLCGDAKEKLLRKYYSQFSDGIEKRIETVYYDKRASLLNTTVKESES